MLRIRIGSEPESGISIKVNDRIRIRIQLKILLTTVFYNAFRAVVQDSARQLAHFSGYFLDSLLRDTKHRLQSSQEIAIRVPKTKQKCVFTLLRYNIRRHLAQRRVVGSDRIRTATYMNEFRIRIRKKTRVQIDACLGFFKRGTS